ncbi:MAG: NifU family protein, partial [Candidatus Fonsibacter sp.]
EVELQGSCSGCPSSSLTLKQGVERMLKHYVPEVQSVKAVSI